MVVAAALQTHPSSLLLVLAGVLSGAAVGLTGMGGGALLTPLLVLVFRIEPRVAIASDLVSSLVNKPIGGLVHRRRGTVSWPLVGRLVAGSVPAAFLGAWVLNLLGDSKAVQTDVKVILGWSLLVACASLLARAALTRRTREVAGTSGASEPEGAPVRGEAVRAEAVQTHAVWAEAVRADAVQTDAVQTDAVRTVPTVLVGVVGGFMVGLTSVGSGSVMIVLLMLLYPRLSAKRFVGTDLVQAVPLVASATLGQVLFGHVDLGVAVALTAGSVPGVYLGARLSSRAPDRVIRPVLVVILLASALALLFGDNDTGLALTLGIGVAVGVPLWAAVDASFLPASSWSEAGLDGAGAKGRWIALLAIGAPFGVGLVAAVAYAAGVRPRVAGTAGATAPRVTPASRPR